MNIPIYQVDAFADALFSGNPAAVCPLPHWLPEKVLKNIAAENNLSETAFIVTQQGEHEIRWFTPEDEVDLCGHATLAAAYVMFHYLGYEQQSIALNSRSGILNVSREGEYLALDFPALMPELCEAPEALEIGLAIEPEQVYKGYDYIVEYANETELRAVEPNLEAFCHLDGRGVVLTAPADEYAEYDFVSRAFFPKLKVPEDPVTGSAHCELAPLWASVLGKQELIGYQASARGGRVHCTVKDDRVTLKGQVVPYLKGEILIPSQLLRDSE
ncbi:PhzF family phenazine biosynthesis protein [Lysobacter sp. N42]|nr:PhzF family phenazine biosynthesis protein [Aliidiomarina sp. B3213]RTE87806.1 PhzF family phenazine biosynthesis protein [Aliidiomarina sp. B3213]TCZ93423.1 PhzF family phenazine biosynthesis protein [Lysobacter sp. N42]